MIAKLRDSRDRRVRLLRRVRCCALLLWRPCAGQRSETTFHVDVKLVNIFVNVTDQNGAIVGGLTRDDFAVFEDGRPQQIASSNGSRSCR